MTLHRLTSQSSYDAPCMACGGAGPRGGACTACGAALAASKHLAGGTVLGSYRIDEVLGEGGMGIVYLATHVRLARRVAIKVLRSEYATNEQALRRFFAEARAVNTIAHPNVIEITDFVERPGDDNYYVMELLEGVTLAALIDAGGIPSLQRSVTILTQLAAALAAVHAAGIVHRDIKPDNVVLIQRGGQDDFVKLVDFGVAKLVGPEHDAAQRQPGNEPVSTHRTHHGAILGTPDFMSPQQASGQAVDHRSDVYAFGVLMYLLATGRLPHTADSFGEMVVQLLVVEPARPRDVPDREEEVPARLDELIMRCLAKDPANRPSTIDVVMKELDEIAEEEGWLVYELNVRSAEVPRTAIPRAITSDPPSEGTRPPPDSSPPPGLEAAAPPQVSDEPAITSTRRRTWPVAAVVAVALVALVTLTAVILDRDSIVSRGAAASTREQVDAEIALANARISAGRLVGPGGDEAIDHLLAARKLDPTHAGVRAHLDALEATFERLADQALSAGSLAEAAAHLQAILIIDPTNALAASRMHDIEQQMLSRQRGP